MEQHCSGCPEGHWFEEVVLGEDWSFDATIRSVEGGTWLPMPPEESFIIVGFTFNTIEECPIHRISQSVDIIPNIVVVSHGHCMRSAMVAIQPFLVVFQPSILKCFDFGSILGHPIFDDVILLCGKITLYSWMAKATTGMANFVERLGMLTADVDYCRIQILGGMIVIPVKVVHGNGGKALQVVFIHIHLLVGF